MRTKLTARRVTLVASVIAAAAIAVPLSIGSSHREAPNIMLDPSADNTDVYAFTADDAPNALTVVANWIPGEVPANGPNFFRFDDRARYYINIDNTGEGKPDIRYLFKFKTSVRNPNSFLYAGPGTQDFNDPGLNVSQRYKLVRETLKKNGKVASRKTVGSGLPVAPPNIGPKTFPNYQNFVAQATNTLADGTKVFAGSRDDPFFVDLGATFDAINVRQGTGNVGQGKDDFSGYSTSSTIIQVPEQQVTRDQQLAANSGEPRRRRLVELRASQARAHQRDEAREGARPEEGQPLRPGLASRQPPRQRGGHPAGPEGSVQPHDPGR